MKIHIRTTCSFCNGEAYLPVREAMSYTGERYTQHRRCAYCLGSGEQDKWVSLREFVDLLERATSMEPDYQELARVQPTSQYQDSLDAVGI
ncbi:hypothetical protein ACFLY4_08725 [Chloroflexota bacterium]